MSQFDRVKALTYRHSLPATSDPNPNIMLRLDSNCIRKAMDARFGGSVTRLTEALSLDPPPDRSTVTRWLLSDGRHFPRDEERLLALAGALDVDPTALWTFDAETFHVLWPKVTKAARTGRWTLFLTPLSFMRHFTEPSMTWPPQPIAERFFGRDWTVHEFTHDPHRGTNFYESVILRAHPSRRGPQVWHFAFRPNDRRPREWKPFGFIRRDEDRATLFSDFGLTEERACRSEDFEVAARTWFGPGSALFRVASLHAFTLTVREPGDGVPVLRFGFPGEIC